MFISFMLLCLLLIGTAAQDFFRFSDAKEFQVDASTHAAGHDAARKICRDRGGDLATLRSQEEFDFIVDIIKNGTSNGTQLF